MCTFCSIENVAAGSINGFWVDGGEDPIDVFSGNIVRMFFVHSHFKCLLLDLTFIKIIPPQFHFCYQAHSNLNEGIKLYQGLYRPDAPSLFVNSKSFRNYRQGVRLHLNKNLIFKGLLLADNGIGVSSFDNNNQIILEDMIVTGLTAKARELSALLNPQIPRGIAEEIGLCRFCHHMIDGVKFASDPSHTQLSLRTVSFRGFEPHFDGTNEFDILALRLWGAFPGMHGAFGTSIVLVTRCEISCFIEDNGRMISSHSLDTFSFSGTILHGSECS